MQSERPSETSDMNGSKQGNDILGGMVTNATFSSEGICGSSLDFDLDERESG